LPAKDPKGIAGKLGEIVAVEADGFTVSAPMGASRSPACSHRRQEDRSRRVAKSAGLAVKARFS